MYIHVYHTLNVCQSYDILLNITTNGKVCINTIELERNRVVNKVSDMLKASI